MRHKDLESWMKENEGNMLRCPRQPGNLKISRQSCAQRFISANSKRIEQLPETTDYFFALKENFKLCRNCAVGEGNLAACEISLV